MMLLGVFIKFINFTCAGVFVINYDFHNGLRHVRKRYVLHTTTPAYTFRVSSPTATSPHPPPTSPHPPPPPQPTSPPLPPPFSIIFAKRKEHVVNCAIQVGIDTHTPIRTEIMIKVV